MAESRAWTHWNRYETDGDIGDLAGAIAAMAAGEQGPDALTFVLEHVDRLVAGEQVSLDLVEEADREYWAGLFFSVAGVFDQVPDALEQAIAAMSASLDLLDTVGATVLLGRYLTMRGTPEDLRAGLALLRAGMERTTADEPTLGPLHMFICGALAHLYELEDTPAIGIELAEALTAALAELPGEDLTATIELARYVAGQHLSNGRDLAEELAMRRLLVAVNPHGSPDRPIALYMLATNLAVRAMSARAPADTEEAIALLREAVVLPEGPLPQALIRSFLSMCLSQLQEMTGIRGLHDEAVALAREGLAQAPPELYDYCLENFGTALTGRYMENHDVADLDEIITKLGGLDTAGVVRGISLVCAAYTTASS